MRSSTAATRPILLALALAATALLAGCGGSFIPAYTGGGFPPGEPDIGGVVLAEASTQTQTDAAAQATIPVVGAEVVLLRGNREVGRATTGAGGHFAFEKPASGQYRVRVTPPAGSGLSGATRQFRHQSGRQTFLSIVLQRE
jgi:hypothetical protein